MNATSTSPLSEIIAALILVVRRSAGLVLWPYKTMRIISGERKNGQWIWINGVMIVVLLGIEPLRITFFIMQLLVTLLFMAVIFRMYREEFEPIAVLNLFSYAQIPTLFWFSTGLLMKVLTLPYVISFQDKAFDVVFIAFSLSLLVWRGLLLYFAIRYATKRPIGEVVYTMVLYCTIMAQLSYVGYVLGVSKIPVI